MRRRKKRERAQVCVQSLICAAAGVVGLVFLLYSIYTTVAEKKVTKMTAGLSMVFFFLSLIELCAGIRYGKKTGRSVASRVWGIIVPAASFAGYALCYAAGLYFIL